MLSFALKKSALAVAAIALTCGFTNPASAFFFDRPRPFDGGGNISAYYAESHASAHRGGRTVIAGVCASACTMKLGARNVCIEPDATLWFHQASNNGFRSELGTRVMLYSYPTRIRQWVMRSGALNSSSVTELSGRQAIAMGVRSC